MATQLASGTMSLNEVRYEVLGCLPTKRTETMLCVVDGSYRHVEGLAEMYGDEELLDWTFRTWNQLWEWEWRAFGEIDA